MVKKNEPPGYPGDEAVKKAFGEALRELRLQKGPSLEEADALLPGSVATESISPPLSRIGHCGSATAGKTEDVMG